MFPDGGIARFRLFGVVVPVFPDPSTTIDLAHVANGGLAVAFSDQHFGKASNLLLPGRGVDMGDGWETRRSRGGNHRDWVIVKLGTTGLVEKVVVDTAHFKGNFPKTVKVEATSSKELVPSTTWNEILGPQKCAPHKEHEYTTELTAFDTPYTHVRLTIIPDGGVKRLRIYGKRV
jgi:allantoicase